MEFLEKTEWPFTRKNKKGKSRTLDLKPIVRELKLPSSETADMILEEEEGHSVRPAQVLGSIFGLPEEALKLATIVKSPASMNGRTPEV
jgi:hypothetical protein